MGGHFWRTTLLYTSIPTLFIAYKYPRKTRHLCIEQTGPQPTLILSSRNTIRGTCRSVGFSSRYCIIQPPPIPQLAMLHRSSAALRHNQIASNDGFVLMSSIPKRAFCLRCLQDFVWRLDRQQLMHTFLKPRCAIIVPF